eukprot:scaffold71526_cov70-Phaeocystis_antarctica.AAC.4
MSCAATCGVDGNVWCLKGDVGKSWIRRVGVPAMRRSRRDESSPSARATAAGANGRLQWSTTRWRRRRTAGAPDPQEVEQWHAQFAHPELLCF